MEQCKELHIKIAAIIKKIQLANEKLKVLNGDYDDME